jgi:hypothetical protein
LRRLILGVEKLFRAGTFVDDRLLHSYDATTVAAYRASAGVARRPSKTTATRRSANSLL